MRLRYANYFRFGAVHAAMTFRAAWLLAFVLPLLAAPLALGAEREICEGLSGRDLVRCVEATAKGLPPPAAEKTAPPSVGSPRGSAARSVPVEPPAASRTPVEDCTGKNPEEMRRCLAAGGRLQPSAAVIPDASRPTSTAPIATSAESCDGQSGEALRQCVELAARSPQRQGQAHTAARHEPIVCTGYQRADQPLCVHRNTAITECRNRQKYPDVDVCLRSQMARAPTPEIAGCKNLQARARAHCEARNQAYGGCISDKLGYFACLAKKLGTDAVLPRR